MISLNDFQDARYRIDSLLNDFSDLNEFQNLKTTLEAELAPLGMELDGRGLEEALEEGNLFEAEKRATWMKRQLSASLWIKDRQIQNYLYMKQLHGDEYGKIVQSFQYGKLYDHSYTPLARYLIKGA